MKTILSAFKFLIVLALLAGLGFLFVIYYPWLFGKKIDGEIIEVERVTMPNAVIGQVTKFQMHSYAVLIQDKNGEMFTSSSEDRRWEVAKKGMCVITLFYRHAPWQLQSAGAFFNARVQKIYRCPGKEYPEETHSDVNTNSVNEPTHNSEADKAESEPAPVNNTNL